MTIVLLLPVYALSGTKSLLTITPEHLVSRSTSTGFSPTKPWTVLISERELTELTFIGLPTLVFTIYRSFVVACE